MRVTCAPGALLPSLASTSITLDVRFEVLDFGGDVTFLPKREAQAVPVSDFGFVAVELRGIVEVGVSEELAVCELACGAGNVGILAEGGNEFGEEDLGLGVWALIPFATLYMRSDAEDSLSFSLIDERVS